MPRARRHLSPAGGGVCPAAANDPVPPSRFQATAVHLEAKHYTPPPPQTGRHPSGQGVPLPHPSAHAPPGLCRRLLRTPGLGSRTWFALQISTQSSAWKCRPRFQ